MARIGFVGAGRMGRPMVRRLIGAGHDVTVHHRSGERVPDPLDDGAKVSRDLAEVAAGADAVVVTVLTDAQVRSVCLEDGLVPALEPGALLVIHTTSSPRTVEQIRATGVSVVDAPVSGGPHDIAAGGITLFVGADAPVFARAESLLAAYGDPILHVGPPGTGQKVKLLNNAVFAANIGVLAVVARLAGELGLSEAALLQAVRHASGDSRALAGAASRGSVGRFAADIDQFLGKDVDVVRSILGDLNLGLADLEPLYEATQGRIAHDHGSPQPS